MGKGYLKIEATTASGALPVPGVQVSVRDGYGKLLYGLATDASGGTEVVELYAPDGFHTMSPEDPGPYYAVYAVELSAPGYRPVAVYDIQIFDGETSILPVHLEPQVSTARSGSRQEIVIPPNSLNQPREYLREGPGPSVSRLSREVVIPDTITVHLGTPASNARNVRVRFSDYIKNVASSEIYPTWPDAALEANIYCQISFALNRVYTEWYTSRGYAFHITSSTAYDQSYVDGRNIFANISNLVDEIFNRYVRRAGHQEPYFTQYCNGTTVTCSGLSQWGTVPLAQQGLHAYAILRNFYPGDIQLVASNRIEGIAETYPGTPLRQGSSGEAVRFLQTCLNRIRVNYPLIPSIASVNGSFGADTTAAVRTFQSVFDLTVDGIVGRGTWYKMIQIYNAVKRLAELDSEGERAGIGETPPTSVLREGSRGRDVVELQFLLNYLGEFYSDIPVVLENSIFDAQTRLAVTAFQRRFNLSQDGIVGPATWNLLYKAYQDVEGSVEIPSIPGEGGGGSGGNGGGTPYPGTLLREGSRGEDVRLMQRYLNAIFRSCPGYASLAEDGIFGPATRGAVVAFQRMEGLAQDGIIGPQTWSAIVKEYGSVN